MISNRAAFDTTANDDDFGRLREVNFRHFKFSKTVKLGA
jgi:hypothetical protein